MTISSVDTVDTTLIQDGQAAGSITPADMRILSNSLSGRFSPTAKTVAYTAVLADRGTLIGMNSATAILLTIPLNSSVAYDIGTIIGLERIGVGGSGFVGASGVTLVVPTGTNSYAAATGSIIWARKRATDTWTVFGDLQKIFYASGGRIIAPDGQPFIAKGINIADWAAVQNAASSGSDNGLGILKYFPGINLVRLNMQATTGPGLTITNGNVSPGSIATFVANLTAAKIVVMIEDHTGTATTKTGATLTTEVAWYVSHATANLTNPYVWYSSQNEPDDATAANITLQHVAIYNGLRGAGVTAPILMCMKGGFTVTGLTTASYSTMVNIGWDSHYYNWQSSNSTSTPTIISFLQAQIANHGAITSADGVMPTIIGEYGNSTSGASPDAGGTQVIMAVQGSGYGNVAWTWVAGASDLLITSGTTLTSFGNEVAAYLAGGPTSGSTLGSSLYGTLGP